MEHPGATATAGSTQHTAAARTNGGLSGVATGPSTLPAGLTATARAATAPTHYQRRAPGTPRPRHGGASGISQAGCRPTRVAGHRDGLARPDGGGSSSGRGRGAGPAPPLAIPCGLVRTASAGSPPCRAGGISASKQEHWGSWAFAADASSASSAEQAGHETGRSASQTARGGPDLRATGLH